MPDAAERCSHEVEIVVMGDGKRIRVLGEATWGDRVTAADVDRLQRIRGLLQDRGYETADTHLCFCAGGGFTPELHRRARRERLVLEDLERLFEGS